MAYTNNSYSQPAQTGTGQNVDNGVVSPAAYAANGQSGSMTGASLNNAVQNQMANGSAPAGSNPYAAAAAAGATMFSALKGTPTAPTNSPGGYQSPPYVNMPSQGGSLPGTSSSMRSSLSGAPTGQNLVNGQPAVGVQPPPMQAAPQPMGAPNAKNDNPAAPLDPSDTTGAGGTGGVPGATNPTGPGGGGGGGGSQPPVTNLAYFQQKADQYNQQGGVTFITPQHVQQYHAWVNSESPKDANGKPTGEGTMTFSEWMVRNHPELTSTANNPIFNIGMSDWSRRLQQEGAARFPGKDIQWVTPQKVAEYYQWYIKSGGGIGPDGTSRDFWGWAGDPSLSKPPDPLRGTPKDAAGIRSRATDLRDNPEKYLDKEKYPEYADEQSQLFIRAMIRNKNMGMRGTGAGQNVTINNTYGNTQGGAGAGAGGEVGYNPQGNDYLNSLKQSLQQGQSEELDRTMREFRHNAALGNMQEQGSYGTMSNELMRGALADNNKQLNEVMFTGSENEQERMLKWAIANIKKPEPNYGDINNTQMTDIQRAQLDNDRYQFDQSLGLDYWNLILNWYNAFGSMPGPNGPPMPTVPVVH